MCQKRVTWDVCKTCLRWSRRGYWIESEVVSSPKLDPRHKQNDSGLQKSTYEILSIGILERDLKRCLMLTSIQDSGGSLLDMTWRIQSSECSVTVSVHLAVLTSAFKKLGCKPIPKLHTCPLISYKIQVTTLHDHGQITACNCHQLPYNIYIFFNSMFVDVIS